MGWTKGKPRLSDEERAARAVRSERAMYDYVLPVKHGDGKRFGCGETFIIVRLLDPEADAKKAAASTEHRKTCWSEKKGG